MKKLLLVAAAALLVAGMAGIAVAASSAPTETNVDFNIHIQTLDDGLPGWTGHGTVHWDTFMIYYDASDHTLSGWWQNDPYGGTITGTWSGASNPTTGSGTFTGDYNGIFGGVFLLEGDCAGYTTGPTNPPGTGAFYGTWFDE